MEINTKYPKFSIEIKQSARGVYYLGSLRINTDTLEELETLMNSTLPKVTNKIRTLNSKSIKDSKPRNDEEIILNDKQMNIYKKLKQLRLEIAKDEGVPSYVIFHNVVLKRMVKFQPKTKEEMLKIKGIGQKSYKKYGDRFLSLLNALEFENAKSVD